MWRWFELGAGYLQKLHQVLALYNDWVDISNKSFLRISLLLSLSSDSGQQEVQSTVMNLPPS